MDAHVREISQRREGTACKNNCCGMGGSVAELANGSVNYSRNRGSNLGQAENFLINSVGH
jgi:hypothetical protein